MRNKWKADNYDNETIPFKIAKVAVPILSIPPAFIFFLLFVDLLISNKVALICFVLCIILIPFAILLNREE